MAKKRKHTTTNLDAKVGALVREYQNLRFRRPKHRIVKRSLGFAESDLRDAQKTLRWLRRRPWHEEGSRAEQALVAIEEEARRDIDRLKPHARGQSVNPAKLTPLLVKVSKLVRRDVPLGERDHHCRMICALLANHDLKLKLPSVRQALRNHHLKNPNDHVFK